MSSQNDSPFAARFLVAPGARRALRACAAVAAGLLGLAPASAIAAAAAQPATTSTGAAAYVSSNACAPCHSAQYQAWLGSNHERAMQIASPKTVLGDFRDASLKHFGITSRFFTRGGQFFAHTEGADGKLGDFEIKYTFGVEPLQQYLI